MKTTQLAIPALTALLISIIMTGNFWHKRLCCDVLAATPLILMDDKVSVAQSTENLIFTYKESTPEVSGEVKTQLQKIAAYLKANPEKELKITGKYALKEKNDNLGKERAEAVKKLLVENDSIHSQILTESLQHRFLIFLQDKSGVVVKFEILGHVE